MGSRKVASLLLAAIAIALVAAACGSDSGSTATEGTLAANPDAPAAGFHGYFASYGKEASEHEREIASKVLEENLEARAALDWEGWCASLSARLVFDSEEEAKILKVEPICPKVRAVEARSFPKSFFANTMSGPIGALRIGNKKSYALYHGSDGKDYSVMMLHEDVGWKVDSYAPEELR